MSDVIHIAIPSKTRREGSVALNIPGTGTQFIDYGIVERPVATISGLVDDKFDMSDQHIIVDGQPIGISGIISMTGVQTEIIYPRDSITHALNTITYEHHEIHDGSHYTFSTGIVDLDNGISKNYILTVPNTTKWPHLVYDIEGVLFTKVEAFENTTHATGTQFPTFNNNRNSTNIAGLKISNSSGNASDGDLIYTTSFGISTGPGGKIAGGGGARGEREWILKQNTKYFLKITSLTDNNNISCILEWYEHINK